MYLWQSNGVSRQFFLLKFGRGDDGDLVYCRHLPCSLLVKVIKVKVNEYCGYAVSLTASGTHVPYGIRQRYLPPGR